MDDDRIGEAATGEDAIRLTGELVPDVVLMDLQMPGMGGVEPTGTLVRETPRIGVIMLPMFEDDESVVAAMRAGARGG